MKEKKWKERQPKTWYYERNLNDYLHFCSTLQRISAALKEKNVTPVFLCIGSDRLTGDCLGPLVGHKLKEYFPQFANLYGTLEFPVHALNLCPFLKKIEKNYDRPFLIAIDASLGLHSHVGSVTLSQGGLFPGEGVKKNLPKVGNLSITGIVNSCHGDSELLLQSTRLHLVNELADFIFMGIANGFCHDFFCM